MGVYTDGGASKRQRVITYVVLGGIFLVLAIVAVATFRTAQESKAARDQATQLQQAFVAAGLPSPNVDQVVRQLGTDGGVVCAAAKDDPLARAQLQAALDTDAGGVGARPLTAAPDQVVAAIQQVIRVYCPEQMNDFVGFVNQLRGKATTQSS
jgi:hypothetical protein